MADDDDGVPVEAEFVETENPELIIARVENKTRQVERLLRLPETEQDFKRFWDEFRSSSSEKEKEEALEMALEVFCKLSKKNGNAPQLASMLVDARLFSFVVARALVTDVEKLKGEDIINPYLKCRQQFLIALPQTETTSILE